MVCLNVIIDGAVALALGCQSAPLLSAAVALRFYSANVMNEMLLMST